jgi:O-acetyl-ADP-ribose deacetylase
LTGTAIHLPRGEYHLDLRVGDPDLVRLVRGDITRIPVDAVVNAANSDLLPGAGVCGAIHRAGGPAIAKECRELRSSQGPVPPGRAVATTAGTLPAQCVIHTVGPVWHGGGQKEAEVLASSFRECMRIADERKLNSISFPAISTGVYGYPVEQAAAVAISTIVETLLSAGSLVLVLMVLFDKNTLDIFARTAMELRQPGSSAPYEFNIGTNS